MKKTGMIFLAAALCVASLMPLTAEAQTESQTRGEAPARVTHADLARILVNLLGLARFVPTGASDLENFAVLMENKVTVSGPWTTDATVTKGDLALAVVKSLRAMGEPVDADIDTAKDAIEWLRQAGIPIDTIRGSMGAIRPLADPTAANVLNASTDPLDRREVYSTVDEPDSGADATRAGRGAETAPYAAEVEVEVTIQEIATIIAAVATPERPTTPPTPFR